MLSGETGNSNGNRVQLRARKHSERAFEFIHVDVDKLVACNEATLSHFTFAHTGDDKMVPPSAAPGNVQNQELLAFRT